MNEILLKKKDNYENHKIVKKPYIKHKLSRYNSAIFLNNYMQKKKIIKLKDNSSIKNVEFPFPKKIIPLNSASRNIPKFRLKNFPKSISIPQINKPFKLIKSDSMLYSNKYIENYNENNVYNNIQLLNKQINSVNEQDNESIKVAKTFYGFKIIKSNNFINNYLNKFSETEKPERQKKQSVPIIDLHTNIIKDRLPIKTLKHFHRYLFHNNNICDCNEEEKKKINNYEQSYESSSQFNNKICEYDIMEIGGKKNYVATKLTKNKNVKGNLNKSKSLINLNIKKKDDFHYIMKHPFSNSFFCSSFINQLTDYNNNSYTNNFSQKFQNLSNPLDDKDLTDKLHSLILNPNTSKIRNGELLLMYKKYPKGTFYNIYKNNNNDENNLLYNEELKQLEKTKYKKYIIKLNKTLKRIKNMQKLLDNFTSINKKNYN